MTWEICHASGVDSHIQTIADSTAAWSGENEMELNAIKTKEMVISFSRKFPVTDLPLVTLGDIELERISSAKILGVIVSDNLAWGGHVDYICQKASQRLYFLILLRRAGATCCDLITFYKSVIRSGLEYAVPFGTQGLLGNKLIT